MNYEENADVLVEEELLLDFTTAMRDFCAMFPNLTAARIEQVLRERDGDVSATINTLLFDQQRTQHELGSSRDPLDQLKMRRRIVDEKLRANQTLLDRVTDVESARSYEDQQLALLLEHQDLTRLIKAKKAKAVNNKNPKTSKERVPNGPIIETSINSPPKCSIM